MEIGTTHRLYQPEFFPTEARIIQWFKESVENNTFIYISTEHKRVVGYHSEIPLIFIQKAVLTLRNEGYDVKYEYSYCAHGPFNSIVLTV